MTRRLYPERSREVEVRGPVEDDASACAAR
jgi:hypothetical protein